MSSFAKLGEEIWRSYETGGYGGVGEVPSSGEHFINRPDMRTWMAVVEPMLASRSILTADRTGTDSSSAQAVFGTSADALTVLASTSYEFEALYLIARAAGTTAHTTGVLFGGTATFTSVDYLARCSNPTGNVLGSASEILGQAATEVIVTASNNSATENLRISLRGIMRINAGGTIIPQFKYSAAPGGPPSIYRNTFFNARAIGSNTVATVGSWA